MLTPMDLLVIPNVARRMPPIAEMINDIMDFLAIWVVTLLLLIYCFIVFLMEGPFILLLFLILAFSIYL
jgi:hypothetical protein